MRHFAPSSAFFAAGALAWGCAVYDSELLPADDGLSGSGATSSDGGRAGMVTGGASTAGKTNNAGTKPTEGENASSGGTQPVAEGGVPGEEGGSDGEGPAGSGGSAGAGGNGGSAGAAGSGGKGGSAGGPPTVKCSDHPLTIKSSWMNTASMSSLGTGVESDGLYNPPSHLTDGVLSERWSSGKTQAGDEWIEIDFGSEVTLSQVTLQLGGNPNDWPRGYAIRVSSTTLDFNAAVLASGVGAMATDVVASLQDPVSGRYLLVRQTGVNMTTTSWWSVAEVLVGCVD